MEICCSSIKNVKAIKCALDGDEYYYLRTKHWLFMLEKEFMNRMWVWESWL